MNNRRKQLMLASAKEYCKCVVEGKTLRYNQLVQSFNSTNWNCYSGTATFYSNGFAVANAVGRDGIRLYDNKTMPIDSTHKYFRRFYCKTDKILQFYCVQSMIINVSNDFELHEDIIGFNGETVVKNCDIFPYSVGDIGNFEIRDLIVIDLTLLGLDNITSVADFYETDLGKYIAKGNYLPYEPNGAFIHAQSPINFEGVNVWNEQWENGIWYYGTKLTSGGYANFLCSKDKIKVYPNTQYFYYCGTGRTNDYIQLEFYDKNGTTISRLIKDNNSSFVTPDNCYSIAFYINDSYGTTYNHDICINEYNENYNGKYYKYCGNSVFESGLTLYKGDTYKTYGIDEISYNNLIPNANQNYVNSDTDTRAGIILSVYDYTNNVGVFVESISADSFYEFTFTSNTTTNGAKIYNSGVSINQNFTENISLTNGHLYYLSLNLISCNANVVGGLRIANLRLIDLTELGLSALTDKLRIFLQKNYKLPFTLVNKTIKDQIVRTMTEIDLSTLTWLNNDDSLYALLPSGFKTFEYSDTQTIIAEKYPTGTNNGQIYITNVGGVGYCIRIEGGYTLGITPSGKALCEMLTPQIIDNFVQSFEVWFGDTSMWEDNEDYTNVKMYLKSFFEYAPTSIENDDEYHYPDRGDLAGLVASEYGYCFINGRLFMKMSSVEWESGNGLTYTFTATKVPTRMVSRRTINVESENEIDLDFTKE